MDLIIQGNILDEVLLITHCPGIHHSDRIKLTKQLVFKLINKL
jgi:hypothetical protein